MSPATHARQSVGLANQAHALEIQVRKLINNTFLGLFFSFVQLSGMTVTSQSGSREREWWRGCGEHSKLPNRQRCERMNHTLTFPKNVYISGS